MGLNISRFYKYTSYLTLCLLATVSMDWRTSFTWVSCSCSMESTTIGLPVNSAEAA